MPDHQTKPTLDPVATTHWLFKAPLQTPWLHDQVALRMHERLDCIKTPVHRWLCWNGARSGGLVTQNFLEGLYPQAMGYWLEENPRYLNNIKQNHNNKRLKTTIVDQYIVDPKERLDLLWSNMHLHTIPQPIDYLEKWFHLLREGGFLMYTCLGPDTLIELRTIYQQQGWPEPTHQYTDMHDWGDWLLKIGYADPVVDVERVVLQYPNSSRLLEDLRELGQNFSPYRFTGLRTPHWYTCLTRAITEFLGPQPSLTFEIIYAHAYKIGKPLQKGDETTIALEMLQKELQSRSAKK
jgi:malonyl-CoA O-methyltransferase